MIDDGESPEPEEPSERPDAAPVDTAAPRAVARPIPPPPGHSAARSSGGQTAARNPIAPPPAHIVDVEVVRIDGAEVEVRLADGRTGVIDRRDFPTPPSVGETIAAAVLSRDDDRRGRVALSHRWARTEQGWQRVEKARHDQTPLTGRVTKEVKGGLVVDVGLRAFLPTSLIGEVDLPAGDDGDERAAADDAPTVRIADPSTLVGHDVEVVVTEADRDRDRLVVSRRDLQRRRRRQEEKERLSSLRPGSRVTGRVVSVADYGAVVDLGGVRGLVHRSELSWQRFDSPADVVSVGDEVEVEVLDVNRSKKRIGLSLRATTPDPYEGIEVDQVVPAVVTRVVDYGAFARLDSGAEGLIHMSELSEVPGTRPDQLVVPGDELTVKVLDVDRGRHRIGLSVKRVLVDDRDLGI